MHKIKHLRRIVSVALPGIIFLVGWEYFVHGNPRLTFLFSSPSGVFEKAATEYFNSSIWYDIFQTGSEAFAGLVIGTILGTLCGLLLWGNGKTAPIVKPYLTFFGAIPIFSLAPMLIIWFGIGIWSKIIMASFGVFFIALTQAWEGATFADTHYSRYARTLGVPTIRIVKSIIIPGALRWVMLGMKVNVGIAVLGSFIGEFVSSQQGLGHYIIAAGSIYDVAGVLFGVMNLSLLALIFTFFLNILQKKIIK